MDSLKDARDNATKQLQDAANTTADYLDDGLASATHAAKHSVAIVRANAERALDEGQVRPCFAVVRHVAAVHELTHTQGSSISMLMRHAKHKQVQSWGAGLDALWHGWRRLTGGRQWRTFSAPRTRCSTISKVGGLPPCHCAGCFGPPWSCTSTARRCELSPRQRCMGWFLRLSVMWSLMCLQRASTSRWRMRA